MARNGGSSGFFWFLSRGQGVVPALQGCMDGWVVGLSPEVFEAVSGLVSGWVVSTPAGDPDLAQIFGDLSGMRAEVRVVSAAGTRFDLAVGRDLEGSHSVTLGWILRWILDLPVS